MSYNRLKVYILLLPYKKDSFKLDNKIYLHYDNQFEWPENNNSKDLKITSCHGATNMIAILVDGTVVPCCLDAKASVNLGNILQQNINEILKSPRYLNLVKGFQTHQISEEFCKNCTFRLRFK